MWVPVKYEKLPHVCFECCQIVHVGRVSSREAKQKVDNEQFGSWLRVEATGRRRVDQPQFQIQKGRNWDRQ